MPDINQNMFEDNADSSDGTAGKSNKTTLSKAFPRAIQHSSAPTTVFKHSELDSRPLEVELSREGYKKGYVTHVMSNVKTIPGADFANVDMDYGTSNSDLISLEKKPSSQSDAARTLSDNTIVDSGLGPTTQTLDIDSTDDPANGLDVIDAGSVAGAPFPGDGSASPADTSLSNSSMGIHGGTTAAESGIRGTSGGSV